MRIGILSPEFPPRCSGVADHSAKLGSVLIHYSQSVCVWTAEKSPKAFADLKVVSIESPWGWGTLGRLIGSMKEWRPDVLVFQYTPQSFAPKTLGVWLSFPVWTLCLRLMTKARVSIIAHEVNYPIEGTLRGLLLGVPQLIQFCLLALVADSIFFTTETLWLRVHKWMFWRKGIYWLPVGATIESKAIESKDNRESLSPRATSQEKLLLHFGGAHPTHSIEHILAAYKSTVSALGAQFVKLAFVGIETQELEKAFEKIGLTRIPEGVFALGWLSEDQVSEWVNKADLILAPFLDGISTRRSSAMTCFQHGKAVLTTFGTSSGGSIPWEEFCCAPPVHAIEEFAQKAVSLLSNPDHLLKLGDAAKRNYDNRFSWFLTTQQFIPRIEK